MSDLNSTTPEQGHESKTDFIADYGTAEDESSAGETALTKPEDAVRHEIARQTTIPGT